MDDNETSAELRSTKTHSVNSSRITTTSLQNKISIDSWRKYVYPKLAKIPAIIESVLTKIPNLSAPNNQIIQLSSHLTKIKNYIQDSDIELTTVSKLQGKCTEELNGFSTQVTQIVGFDENQNMLDFCTRQTESLALILSAIHSAFDKNQDQIFIVNGKRINRKAIFIQLQAIDDKFEEVKRKLAENPNSIQTTLKSLNRTISESSIVFSTCPSSRDENEIYQNRLKQGITSMMQYIQSSNEALENRKRFQILSNESIKEIQDSFTQALKEETKMNQVHILESKEELTNVTSSITNNDVNDIINDSESTTQKQKNKEIRKKPQTVKSHSAPKHTPVSRPKLYEERRKVSAVGSLRPKSSASKV